MPNLQRCLALMANNAPRRSRGRRGGSREPGRGGFLPPAASILALTVCNAPRRSRGRRGGSRGAAAFRCRAWAAWGRRWPRAPARSRSRASARRPLTATTRCAATPDLHTSTLD